MNTLHGGSTLLRLKRMVAKIIPVSLHFCALSFKKNGPESEFQSKGPILPLSYFY